MLSTNLKERWKFSNMTVMNYKIKWSEKDKQSWKNARAPLALRQATQAWEKIISLDVNCGARWFVHRIRKDLNGLPVILNYIKKFNVDFSKGTNFSYIDANCFIYCLLEDSTMLSEKRIIKNPYHKILFAQLVYIWLESTPGARLLVHRVMWRKEPWNLDVWNMKLKLEIFDAFVNLLNLYNKWLTSDGAKFHRNHQRRKNASISSPFVELCFKDSFNPQIGTSIGAS